MNFRRHFLRKPRTMYSRQAFCGVDFPYPAFEHGWLHGRQFKLAWDIERIVAHMGDGCWISHYGDDAEAKDVSRLTVLAGYWPGGGFLEMVPQNLSTLEDHPRLSLAVYAATPARCQAIFQQLAAGFVHPDGIAAGGPRVGILHNPYGNLEVQRIAISPEQTVPRDQLALFYGAGMPGWTERWLAALQQRRYGLTILTGPPGTGKTTLLRSVAQWLSESHMFYFMPASRFTAVESSEIVKFWADQNRQSSLRKILILEDAESVLRQRGEDNREKVASLLNLTDGMMGDALGLHVVCTLNCDLTELDPALLRPGRLSGQRELGLLATDEARRLAHHLRRPAPDGPATLAEIVHGVVSPAVVRPPRRTRNDPDMGYTLSEDIGYTLGLVLRVDLASDFRSGGAM